MEYLFHEGLIKDDECITITLDDEILRKIRPGSSDSMERGLEESCAMVFAGTKE